VEQRRNIELKARDPDHERSAEACLDLGAEAQGLLVQRDTYFRAARGRLKLREQEGGASQLIAYERADTAGARESRYRIAPVTEPDALKAALADALGVETVVAKRRRLFLWQGVRIHLDEVEGRGRFIEFEAVAAAGSDLSLEAELVDRLRRAFGVEDADLIGHGYADLGPCVVG
jgi:predicted adenylyl cyclase CyaB